MNIPTDRLILIEQRVTNEAKSLGVAYLLWFFLGSLGAHRFYMGRPLSALAIIALIFGGIVAMASGNHLGLFAIGLGSIWVLIDAFLIPGMATKWKNSVRDRLLSEAQHPAI